MDMEWLSILDLTDLSEEEKKAVEERCRARYHWNAQRCGDAEVSGNEVVVYETVGATKTVIGRYQVAGN